MWHSSCDGADTSIMKEAVCCHKERLFWPPTVVDCTVPCLRELCLDSRALVKHAFNRIITFSFDFSDSKAKPTLRCKFIFPDRGCVVAVKESA